MASGQDNLIDEIRGLAAQVEPSEEALIGAFHRLEANLQTATRGIKSPVARSADVTLWEIGDDEYATGFLKFDDGKLILVYRSTEDDLNYYLSGRVEYDPKYSSRALDGLPPEGLRALASVTGSLLADLASKLKADVEGNRAACSVVVEAANDAHHMLDNMFARAARQLNFAAVLEDWTKAQNAIESDPASAIRQARTLLESACKHILHLFQRTEPTGPDANLGVYLKLARELVGRDDSGRWQQATLDMLARFGGVVNALADLRNDASDAHGKSPLAKKANSAEARFAVNTAGLVSTFLMEMCEPAVLPSNGP